MVEYLAHWFITNEVVLLAVYGQVFFVLGLSVALQWRRESRLELARSVPLLAAFGLTNAFAIWGDVFIPEQQQLLPDPDIALLRLLQMLLMLLSYTFLLQFGLRLNWNSGWTSRLPWLLALLGVVILFGAYQRQVPLDLLRLRFEQVARPLFLFAGAVMAAWGMRNTAAQVEAMNLPRHIVGWLRVAGGSLGLYAVGGGLIFPWTVEQLRAPYLAFSGIPVAIPRLLAIGMLAWSMIQALTIFRLELQRAMEDMARLRALATDRQRIGRDLHDGTIQAIYGAGLLLENGMSLMRADPATAESMFRAAMEMLNKTIQDVRRYIFELSEGEGQLAEAMGVLVNELGTQQPNFTLEYRLEGTLPRYDSEVRNHLLQIAREAIINATKHSGGNEIVVSLSGKGDAVLLTIADNGRGLPPGGAFRPGGRGVPNLRARTALIGGTLQLNNRPNGLTVEVSVPYPQSNGSSSNSPSSRSRSWLTRNSA